MPAAACGALLLRPDVPRQLVPPLVIAAVPTLPASGVAASCRDGLFLLLRLLRRGTVEVQLRAEAVRKGVRRDLPLSVVTWFLYSKHSVPPFD